MATRLPEDKKTENQMASIPEVTLYLQEAVTGVAELLQKFPIVGVVCKIFLSFTQVVETAGSNKDDLTELQELFDLVIRGVLQQRWVQKTGADDLEDGFEKLRMEIERASEIAKKCRGNAVKQFLFGRRTSKDIAAVRKNVLGLCTSNTLLLSAAMHAKLDSMSQVWTEKDKRSDGIEEELELVGSSTDIYSSSSSETANQKLRKTPRVKVPGSPRIREWYTVRDAVVFDVCDGLGVCWDASKEPRMVGLAGPSGAGKSTVASMVAARGDVQMSFRKGMLWLPVGKDAKNRLEALMFDLAVMVYETVMQRRCRPPRKASVKINMEDGAAYIREVVDESSRRFLVVADDVWEVEVLEELKKTGAWVLYTTRKDKLLPDAPPLRVDQVRQEEAEMVLRRAAELDDDAPLPDAAYEVMRRCEFVVLDLVLVGRRGEVRGGSDERAWRDVLCQITEAQEEGEGGGQLRPWRAATLRTGLEELASDSPLNKELYLALVLLPTGLAFPSKVAGVLLWGDDCSAEALKTANKVLEVLERLSILALEAGGKYRVHEDHVDFVWDCLKTNRETQDAALPRWRKYISSVEALDTYTSAWLVKIWNVVAQVDERAVTETPYQATLDAMGPSTPKFPRAVRKVAEFHFERRDWMEAYKKYSSLLDFEEDPVNGRGLPEAKILHKLGMCASEMPGYEEKTVKLLRQALKIQERTLGGDHPYVANTLHSLGVCIREAGEAGEAEKLLRQALAIRQEKLSGDPLGLARIQYSLGVCMYNTGRLWEAREMLKPALAIRVDRLGHDHPEVANALYYLGLCDHKTGRTAEGEKKLYQALEIYEQKLGKNHLDVADTLFSLGMCALEAGGRAAEAEKLYRRALAIRQQKLPPQHLKVESAMHALGVCASLGGRMDEARELLEENPGVAYGYEVAVRGGIPMIDKDASQNDHSGIRVLKASGFMNALTKFILAKTESEGADSGDMLAEARDSGNAEADIRHLLAELVFGATVLSDSIEPKGVSPLTAVDLEYAEDMRSTIKMQGTAVISPDMDRLSVYVSPVVVPLHHPFASTEGYGSIISVDFEEWENELENSAGFYVRVTCRDELGIIERIGKLAAANGVSIRAILQNEIKDVTNISFVVMTDPCKQSQVDQMSIYIGREDWARGAPLVMPLYSYPSHMGRFSDADVATSPTPIKGKMPSERTRAPVFSSCRKNDGVNFPRSLRASPPTLDVKEITKNAAGDQENLDGEAFKTSPCPIPRSEDEMEVDEEASKTSPCPIPRSEDEEEVDEEASRTSPEESSLSRERDDNQPSQEVPLPRNTLKTTLTTTLGRGPVTYLSEAHAVEFELQDGSLDDELPAEMTITQGLAFVDCRTDGSDRAPSHDVESTEEFLAMTFVHGPEGVTFPDEKPAKLRFFLGYVDDLAPATESGPDQVVITDEEIERDILEVYRPLSSPDGVENWTILGKYSVVFRRRLGQREVWVETPVLHFSVTANAMKVDKGKKDQSYYYGDLGGLRWWFKGRSSTARIRFGNTTKDNYATFTRYPIVEHTEASSESECHAEIGAVEGTIGGGTRHQSSAMGCALLAAQEKITTIVDAGIYEDCEMSCDVKEHPQMHVRIGVLLGLSGEDMELRGKLQLLDVRKISGNKILVLREPRLRRPVQYRKIDWPCGSEKICEL